MSAWENLVSRRKRSATKVNYSHDRSHMLLKELTLHVSNMYCNEIFWVLALHTSSIFSRPEIIRITCIILENLRKLSSVGPHETEPPFILLSIDCAKTEQVKLKKSSASSLLL